jgi:hypothetical protein
MQTDINVHFQEHNVIELYKALKTKYLRGNDQEYYPEEGLEPYVDDDILTKHLKRAIISTFKDHVQFRTRYNELYMYLSNKNDMHMYAYLFYHENHENDLSICIERLLSIFNTKI